MTQKETIKYVADFETTVDHDTTQQTHTEVWSAAMVEVGIIDPDAVRVWNSIDGFFDYLFHVKHNCKIWFHNLSFDGSFILNWLLRNNNFKQAYDYVECDECYHWHDDKDMENNTFKYTISDMGQWYTITIKQGSKFIRIYDSLKLLPFALKAIGKAFKTKYQKLEMEYKGVRYAGGYISDDELAYIKNDVLVMSEALDIMFNEGHTSQTIGSCCLKDFRKGLSESFYKEYFPNLAEIPIPDELIMDKFHMNADGFIRKAYHGGWCYLVKGKEDKIYKNGITADVNSLYPSVMHSISGNAYPVGKPTFWLGDIPEIVNEKGYYYFVRVKTEFELKKGYLPTIQIKGNPFYKPNEWLETSDIFNKATGKYTNVWYDADNKPNLTTVDMVLTITDWKLIQEHYYLYNTEIVGGCYFATEIGLFDKYIDYWREVKENSTGAMRTLAKLFLNNLYGKLASSDDSSYKVAYLNDNGGLSFTMQEAHEKTLVSVACGAAVTSYARDFTIRHAQMNFYGKTKRGFIYADTDSIHCDLSADELKGIDVHPTKFLHWKLESSWDKAIFHRQKTYIEHVVAENLEPIETPYHNTVCAGMGKRCKQLLDLSLQGVTEIEGMSEDEKKFLQTKRTYKDFNKGLCIPSKLVARQIDGGVLLMETTFEMRE